MEQNANAGAPVEPIVENKQKSGNGLKIATAIACIVAVCGIGFGVYGMVQSSQKDSQISGLKAQILEKTIDNDGITETEDDSVSQREQDYLYLDEFGIKIRIPDNTQVTSYDYLFGYYGLTNTDIKGYGTYEIWAMPKNRNDLEYSIQTTRDYAVRISRHLKADYNCEASCGKEIFTNDKYIFIVHPQVSTIASYGGTMDEDLITTMNDFIDNQYSNNLGFFDKENYSKI